MGHNGHNYYLDSICSTKEEDNSSIAFMASKYTKDSPTTNLKSTKLVDKDQDQEELMNITTNFLKSTLSLRRHTRRH